MPKKEKKDKSPTVEERLSKLEDLINSIQATVFHVGGMDHPLYLMHIPRDRINFEAPPTPEEGN